LNKTNFNELELILGYKFKNIGLIEEALTHSSKKIKNKTSKKLNYERLEFFGDRILGFIISEKIFLKFSSLAEGELNLIFQKYTNENFLYKSAKKLKLDHFIKTQKGDELNNNKSILADVVEAIIAAIYLDSDIENCKNFVNQKILFNRNIISTKTKHPKSDLQELTLKFFKTIPVYELENKTGPDHNPIFNIKAKVNDNIMVNSSGKTIQIAEENAAKKLIPILKRTIKNYD